jgi:hypothetical protein
VELIGRAYSYKGIFLATYRVRGFSARSAIPERYTRLLTGIYSPDNEQANGAIVKHDFCYRRLSHLEISQPNRSFQTLRLSQRCKGGHVFVLPEVFPKHLEVIFVEGSPSTMATDEPGIEGATDPRCSDNSRGSASTDWHIT